MNSYILQMLAMMNPAERDFMGLSQLAQEALKNRNPQKILTNEEIAEKLKGVEKFKESVNYPERKSTGELGTASPYSQVLNPLQTNVRPPQNIWDPAAQGMSGYPGSPQGNMGTTGQQQTWNNPVRPFVGGNRIPQEVSDALIPPISQYFNNWKNPAQTTRFPVEGAHPAYTTSIQQDRPLNMTPLAEDDGMEVGGTVETNRNFAEAMPFVPSSQMAQSGFPDLSLGNLADEKVVEGQRPSTTEAVGPQEQSIWQKLNPYALAMMRAAEALGTPGNYGAFAPAFAKGIGGFATGLQETALMNERRARTDLQRRNVAAQEGELDRKKAKDAAELAKEKQKEIDLLRGFSGSPEATWEKQELPMTEIQKAQLTQKNLLETANRLYNEMLLADRASTYYERLFASSGHQEFNEARGNAIIRYEKSKKALDEIMAPRKTKEFTWIPELDDNGNVIRDENDEPLGFHHAYYEDSGRIEKVPGQGGPAPRPSGMKIDINNADLTNPWRDAAGTAAGKRFEEQWYKSPQLTDSLSKVDTLIGVLETGDVIAGAGSEFLYQIERAAKLFGSKYAERTVVASEVAEHILGSEVFKTFAEMGLTSRNLDTPAEREFLQKVMTGTRALDKETLLIMAKIRRNMIIRGMERWNERVEKLRPDAHESFMLRSNDDFKVLVPKKSRTDGYEVERIE